MKVAKLKIPTNNLASIPRQGAFDIEDAESQSQEQEWRVDRVRGLQDFVHHVDILIPPQIMVFNLTLTPLLAGATSKQSRSPPMVTSEQSNDKVQIRITYGSVLTDVYPCMALLRLY